MSENPYFIENFEDMPNLAERVKNFEAILEEEPCTNMAEYQVGQYAETKHFSKCQVLSNSDQMCPACRLRLFFYHSTHNWDAYHRGEK